MVNVVFLCKTMTKELKERYFVKVSRKAVYDNKKGWLCKCGHWTTGEDDFHVPVSKAKREVYEDGLIS